MALWKNYRKTSFLKVEAAYVKCIKMFFGYEQMFSVLQMFQDLGLPTFNTLLHNTMLGFKNTCLNVNNRLVLNKNKYNRGVENEVDHKPGLIHSNASSISSKAFVLGHTGTC